MGLAPRDRPLGGPSSHSLKPAAWSGSLRGDLLAARGRRLLGWLARQAGPGGLHGAQASTFTPLVPTHQSLLWN